MSTQQPVRALQRTTYAFLDPGATKCLLSNTGVVQGLNTLAPSVNLSLVNVTSSSRILKEQRTAEALVRMLSSNSVGVD